jgi:4-hydroxybenzoate polyprenyltransferase
MPVSTFINKLSNPIRAAHWWKYKAAHILGFAYFYFYLFQIDIRVAAVILLLSATTIIGIAGLGYFINDLYDIEVDKMAGKHNRMANRTSWQRFLIVLSLLMLTLLPWLYLKSNYLIWMLIGFELILFIAYSHPAIRLKERSLTGPLCDALYGHALPVMIACLTYQQYNNGTIPYDPFLFFTTLFCWQVAKGMRNIFIHQMDDTDNDMVSGIRTHSISIGAKRTYKLILYRILPGEILTGALFLYIIFTQTPFILYGVGIFLILYILGHGLFRNTKTGPEHFKLNTFLYFLNDWYEDYYPWLFLLALIFQNWTFYLLGIFHIVFFPETVLRIIRDLLSAISELFVTLKKIVYPVYTLIRKKD